MNVMLRQATQVRMSGNYLTTPVSSGTMVFIAGFCALIVEYAMYPVVALVARRAGQVNAPVRLAIAAQLSCQLVIYFSYTCSMLFIMDSAPNAASMSSVNGLGHTVTALLRSLAPSLSSSLFSLLAQHQDNVAGGNMVYIVLISLGLCALRCSLLLPKKMHSE
ncbi:hypothetical protein C8R43DRAFT_257654 [Mycena crocata]|nr:hypothetical protein C8R43DRAFT_257654 [Mycena crocata]